MFFHLFVPKQASGANLKYFDLFNATGSGSILEIYSCLPIVSGAVAVTGVVGLDLHMQRTSAIGTGGTAATREGTDPTACTISRINHIQNIHASITARLTPTGGATADAVLGWRSLFTEETSSAAYVVPPDLARHTYMDIPPVIVRENTGLMVIQGSVASVGNIGFSVVFKVKPNDQ